MRKKVVITGGTGFIGRALCRELLANNYDVIVLSRNPEKGRGISDERIIFSFWDGQTTRGWLHHVEGAAAIVNLAGDNIASSLRWTAQKKSSLLYSRLHAGRAVTEAVERTSVQPRVVVQASAIGYYGNRGDELLNEFSSIGTGFLADVASQWEQTTRAVTQSGVRHVIIRTGIVLGKNEGFLSRVVLPFRFFAGGHPGNGRQWLSWIHIADEAAAIRCLIEHNDLAGPFNLTAPNPLTAKDFFHMLGTVLQRPSWFPTPGIVLKFIFGEMAQEVLLAGQRVLPKRLMDSGFRFAYPDALTALQDVLQ